MENKIILLVDDSEDDVFLTRRALEKSKIANRIVVTNSGVDALDYLFNRGKFTGRDHGEMPAVVLLDLKMPGMSGIDVLNEIRANKKTKYIPVVMLTASKEEGDKINCYSSGCNAYVSKSVDFDQFSDSVKQLGIFWLLMNETVPCAR